MMDHSGIAINWTMGVGPANIKTQPLYIKYNVIPLKSIVAAELKNDIGEIILTTETQYVSAYLANLLRIVLLIA